MYWPRHTSSRLSYTHQALCVIHRHRFCNSSTDTKHHLLIPLMCPNNQKTIHICQYMTMFQNLNIIYSTNLMIPLLTKCFFPEINTPASHIYLEFNAESYARYTPIPIRAFSSSLLRTLIADNHLPLFKIYSHFAHFPQIFKYFALFCPF